MSDATAEMGQLLPPLFREAYPQHTAKHVQRAAGCGFETARNWVKGRSAPSADVLLRMAVRCERMAAALEAWGAKHDRKGRSGAAPDGRTDAAPAARGEALS